MIKASMEGALWFDELHTMFCGRELWMAPKLHDLDCHLAQDQIRRDFSNLKLVSGVFSLCVWFGNFGGESHSS